MSLKSFDNTKDEEYKNNFSDVIEEGKKIKLIFGRPIPYETFDKSHSHQEWANILKKHVYGLKQDPNREFKVE